jgi:hypothetical protein
MTQSYPEWEQEVLNTPPNEIPYRGALGANYAALFVSQAQSSSNYGIVYSALQLQLVMANTAADPSTAGSLGSSMWIAKAKQLGVLTP